VSNKLVQQYLPKYSDMALLENLVSSL